MVEVTPMSIPQPTRQVLENPDLLFLIFSQTQPANHLLTNYIRVCKAWFDPAAELIWKSVPGLSPAFTLLVPSEDIHVFSLALSFRNYVLSLIFLSLLS